jgi:hypothetical protein
MKIRVFFLSVCTVISGLVGGYFSGNGFSLLWAVIGPIVICMFIVFLGWRISNKGASFTRPFYKNNTKDEYHEWFSKAPGWNRLDPQISARKQRGQASQFTNRNHGVRPDNRQSAIITTGFPDYSPDQRT